MPLLGLPPAARGVVLRGFPLRRLAAATIAGQASPARFEQPSRYLS